MYSLYWINKHSKLTKCRETFAESTNTCLGKSPIWLNTVLQDRSIKRKTVHILSHGEKKRLNELTAEIYIVIHIFYSDGGGVSVALFRTKSLVFPGSLIPWQWGWRNLWVQSSSPPHCTLSQLCCHTRTQHHIPDGHYPQSDSRAPSSHRLWPWCWTCQLPLE